MSGSSSLGVTAASNAATQLSLIYNSVFPAAANATSIGNLTQNQTSINVLSQLTSTVSSDYYTFDNTNSGPVKLSFNGIVGDLGDSDNDLPGSTVDATTLGLRYQVTDSLGNVVADSDGTAAQQAAYASLTSSGGLSLAGGTYTVQVSAAPGTTISALQDYNFQLYSGTTYATTLLNSAQTQAYNPDLFESAASSMAPSSNLALYDNTATMSGTQASALGIGTLDANQNSLDVTSQINAQNSASYYQFNFQQGAELKLTFQNSTQSYLQTGVRVQLYNSQGTLVADNGGTQAQQDAYTELTSGEGLVSANGNYTVKVSYAAGANLAQQQSYNLQLTSGSTYNAVYDTVAQLPSASDAGSTPNLGIFTNNDAQLYSRQAYNEIGETGSSAVQIGWLQQNKSELSVESQLTTADKSDYYSLTLQQGNNLKLSYDNTTNTTGTRVQLLNSTGTEVIADNEGTAAQRAAFASLTSTSGLSAIAGQYQVHVSYAQGANTSATQNYKFSVYSGTTFDNEYLTTASAQTYENAILSGNTNVVGTTAGEASASYLTNMLNGDPNNTGGIMSVLQATV